MSYNIHIPDPCFKHPRPNPTFRGQVVEEFLHLAIEALQARQISGGVPRWCSGGSDCFELVISMGLVQYLYLVFRAITV